MNKCALTYWGIYSISLHHLYPIILASHLYLRYSNSHISHVHTFRSYLRCTVSRWLNTFRVTTMYVSTPSTVSLYMPRNWGSSVLPWHSTINWRQSREERREFNGKCGSEESNIQYENWLKLDTAQLYSLIISAALHHFHTCSTQTDASEFLCICRYWDKYYWYLILLYLALYVPWYLTWASLPGGISLRCCASQRCPHWTRFWLQSGGRSWTGSGCRSDPGSRCWAGRSSSKSSATENTSGFKTEDSFTFT